MPLNRHRLFYFRLTVENTAVTSITTRRLVPQERIEVRNVSGIGAGIDARKLGQQRVDVHRIDALRR